MLEIIIAALLSLGIITSTDQATPEMETQYQTEIQEYIIDVDLDQM